MFVLPLETIKYNCVKAFIEKELYSTRVEENAVVVTKNNECLREETIAIYDRIVEQGVSFKKLEKLSKSFPV